MIAVRLSFFSCTFFYLLIFLVAMARADSCPIPPDAQLVPTSNPDIIVGDGTPESCTSQAFVQAVAQGGIITFNCGLDPVTIVLEETAKIFNNTGPEIVIDGGGKVTLSGGGSVRILYMNTCDQNQVWTTSHCQNQDHPRLTVQNLTFIEGNATGADPDGGGAIFVRGGRFKVLHSRFIKNRCDSVGPDVGGAAIRVLSQYNGLPVYIVDSVFGGSDGLGNVGSNGGGLSSIGVSSTIINSVFSYNQAIGNGANPAQTGTPGGGSGGAIYNDGNTFALTLCGTAIHDNTANEGGGAIFFVSNNRTGSLNIEESRLWDNPSGEFENYPGIFYLGYGDPQFNNTSIGEDEVPHPIAIDVNNDGKIGLAETLYSLAVVAGLHSEELSDYVQKKGDVISDHEIDLFDIVASLKILTGQE